MNIIDIVILALLVLSVFNGFRKGAISSLVTLIGTIAVFILSLYLKTPVSIFMYEHFPFFAGSGIFENITVINILIYEALSFLLTFAILSLIVKLLARVTGIIDKILSKLILLGLPSKILGALVGLIQGYLLIFLILFVASSFAKTASYLEDSKISNIIITKTPVLSDIVGDTISSVREVYEICVNNDNKEQANLESLDVLMKYEILSYDSANNLISNGKLRINNAGNVIEKYKESNND